MAYSTSSLVLFQFNSTVWGYHIYAYIPGATPNTVKLDLNGGIPPFAFSYKDDEDNVKQGYAHLSEYLSLLLLTYQTQSA
jgi:hypothetical protein